ncbi:MAG: YlxR family protein [Lachnospiraceae bacterium]|nr:YlxR family protein [Lachnospiraceae bacterium]MDD3614619.1 YlxR family protein [Lachnospiraceae bacterium]
MNTARKVPLRKCTGCGEMKSKKEMIRVLKTDTGEVILDTTGKKNGRGAYLCPTAQCLQAAKKNKGLEKSLKMAIPKEIYDYLEKEIADIEK